MKLWVVGALIGGTFWVVAGCSSGSDGDGGNGSCTQISGSWTLSGCVDTSCSVSQNGCSVSLSCQPSGSIYSGSVSGNTVSFASSTTSCSANVNGANATGSCTGGGQSCSFTASCSGGACGSSGTGGSGGGSGVDCNQSCAILTGCCPGLTTADCLEGCNLNPNQPPACIACFNDTSCNNLAPCVVANCGLPQEVCAAGGS
jgi:hypothetical protein